MPEKSLSLTFWNGGPSGPGEEPTFKPLRLVRDPENTPIKAEDVTQGSVFHVLPEGLLDLENGLLEEKAKAAVILIRLDPDIIESQKQRDWGYDGIVAYSKICTHVGCPVGLYEQNTHHLLCPCHQSTFDVPRDCKVIFGPARRPLPQLKITVDDEGYLVSVTAVRRSGRPELLGAWLMSTAPARHALPPTPCAPATVPPRPSPPAPPAPSAGSPAGSTTARGPPSRSATS